jgi:hypothetical protein
MKNYKIIKVFWENEHKEKFPKFRIVYYLADGTEQAASPYDFDTEVEATDFLNKNIKQSNTEKIEIR